MKRLVLSVALLSAVALVSAQSLVITPANPTIQVGQSIRLAANGPQIRWSISDPLVATLLPDGTITGRTPGQTIVFALAKNKRQGQTTVTVVDVPPPPPPSEICGDGIDNDGDGLIDENPPCQPPPPPPPPFGRGPQPTLVCPSNAVRLAPGDNIQAAINANPTGTTYCLLAGSHTPTVPIRPKPSDTLQGEFGAIINGQNVQSGEGTGTSVISGWNCAACQNITVRNLTILGRETINCLGAAGLQSGGWIVEYNDIRDCRWGLNHHNPWASQLPQAFIPGWQIRHNVLDNHEWSGATGSDGSGAYGIVNVDDLVFENNEVRNSGGQPKFMATRRAVVRGNWVHHNGFGIWFDGDNLDPLIEGNTLEDNVADGVECEISAGCIIRNNTIKRNGHGGSGSGIYISTTRDSQIYGNVLEDNYRGINLFANCPSIAPAGTFYPTQIEWDLRNVSIHDNAIKVGTPEFTVWGPSFSYTGCTVAQLALYADPNNVKNNRFTNNQYQVTTSGGMWWYWNGFKTFTQWMALGHDATGTVSQ